MLRSKPYRKRSSDNKRPNFVRSFECLVCRRVASDFKFSSKLGFGRRRFVADARHASCGKRTPTVTAMELVETALDQAEAGEWAGAEIGMGEVNFGFEVEDFDLAENIVRNTVKGTPFESIREITRYSDAG